MNNLIKTGLILFTLISTLGFRSNPVTINENGKATRIEVIFNRTIKFNDLVKIKLDLAEKGISLDYKIIEFDKNGGLLRIDFKVNCNDGYSGSAHESNLTNQSKFGFYRDYSKNATSPFGTGQFANL